MRNHQVEFLGVLLLACAAGWAATIHVVEPGTPGVFPAEPYDSWTNAATNIATAVGYASASDTVLVSNGLYLTTSQITVNKAITLQGLQDPETTIVQRAGPGNHRIFLVDHLQAVLAGFTITNGVIGGAGQIGGGVFLGQGALSNCIVSGNMSSNQYGGGIYCRTGLVVNCRIIGNTTVGGYGGGILITNSGIVSNCVIAYNTSTSGGGVGVYHVPAGGPAIVDCLVYSNNAGSTGGGIYLRYSQVFVDRCHIFGNRVTGGGNEYGGGGGIYAIASLPAGGYNSTIRNCLLNDNYSYQSGGGILAYFAIGDVQNCTIVSNYAAATAAGNGGGGGFWIYTDNNGTSVFDNVIIRDNGAGWGGTNWQFRSTAGSGYTITNSCLGWGANGITHYVLPPASRGGGNFGDDPLFADAASANYRLLQHSPCVNTGANRDWMADAADLDGLPRILPAGGVVDIGCYEFYLRPITMITIR